jgi:protein-S-isoprenylcysteine O-methyltransferase Ste14
LLAISASGELRSCGTSERRLRERHLMDHVRITGALLVVTFVWQAWGFARLTSRESRRAPTGAGLLFLLFVVPFYLYWLLAGVLLLLRQTSLLHATAFVYGQAGIARGVGLLLFLVGNILLAATRRPLGRNLQPPTTVPREGNTLATTGAYRIVRHPIYLADVVLAVGLGFMVGSWLFLVFGALMALVLPFVIATEERHLAARFGESWTRYAARTARMIPGVW